MDTRDRDRERAGIMVRVSGVVFRVLVGVFAAAALLAVPATADWLVTADGQRLKTDGPIKVRGEKVYFKIEGGKVVSLPMSAVDIPESRAATRAARSSSNPATSTSARKSSGQGTKPSDSNTGRASGREGPVTLNDENVAAVSPPAPRGDGNERNASGAMIRAMTAPRTVDSRSPPASLSAGVLIDERHEEVSDEGLTITGKLRNSNRRAVKDISLVVTLFDEDDQIVVVSDAQLSGHTLQAGQKTHFRVFFPNIDSYARSELQAWVPPPKSHD